MHTGPFEATTRGVRIAVRVTPRAGRSVITGLVADSAGRPQLKVSVTSAPADGKANASVLQVLAEAFHIAPSRFNVQTGAASRSKLILIDDPDPPALAARLNEWARELSSYGENKDG